MTKQVLFVQGGGENAHDEDAKLAASLRSELGPGYEVRYPQMPNEREPDYHAWSIRIADELARMRGRIILVGHSIGASIVIKWLTQAAPKRALAGVFLIAAPFWHHHDVWRWKEVELPQDPGTRLPHSLALFLYHGSDDEIVPFTHLDLYAKAIPQAHVRPLERRDHQLNDNLADVARDIRSLG